MNCIIRLKPGILVKKVNEICLAMLADDPEFPIYRANGIHGETLIFLNSTKLEVDKEMLKNHLLDTYEVNGEELDKDMTEMLGSLEKLGIVTLSN